jgi:MFS family permease
MPGSAPLDTGEAKAVSRGRFGIYLLLFLMSAINYGDRAALSIGAPTIAQEFHLSPVQVGYLLSSFLWAYFLFNLPAGILADRFGARRAAAFSVSLWSLATMLTGFTFSIASLIATRVVMGIGEAFGFPVGNRAIREWAPVPERGFATALFSSGQAFGTAATSVGVAWLMTVTGWRTAFVVLGVLGFVWVAVWLIFYRDPSKARWLHAREREKILAERNIDIAAKGLSVPELFTYSSTWGLIGVQICANFTNFLLLTWLPGYLVMSRHASVMRGGVDTAICWAIACVITIFIGRMADRFIGAEGSRKGQRRVLVAILLVAASVMMLAQFVESHVLLLAITTIALAAIQSALAMNYALSSDLLRRGQGIGTLIGLLLTFSNGFGILAPILTGYIVGITGHFDVAFELAGGLVLLGATLVLTATRRPIGEDVAALAPRSGS